MAKPGRRRRQMDRRPAAVPRAGEGPAFAVADRDVAARAQELASSWERRVPGVWDALEGARLGGLAEEGWPDWCWLPSEVAWVWAFRRTVPGGGRATRADVESWVISAEARERNALQVASTQLAAAASWRLTRGVYRFDAELRRALRQTEVDEVAPEVFLQLPEWCVYVDLDGGEQFARDRAVGFYAHLDWISRAPDSPMLRLVVAIERQEPRRLVWVPTHLPLAYRSLREAWAGLGLTVAGTGREEQAEAEWAAGMRICLPLLLYLVSQDPDVRHRREPDRRPERRRPERDPGGPNWWEVGYRVGAVLGAGQRPRAEPAPTAGGGAGRPPAPHIRRAHYHLYWTGPGRQEPRLRWLHPILVGDRQEHELPPTIRRVRAPASGGVVEP